jgi:hypothetical protein
MGTEARPAPRHTRCLIDRRGGTITSGKLNRNQGGIYGVDETGRAEAMLDLLGEDGVVAVVDLQ